jgi:hypothetical protein
MYIFDDMIDLGLLENQKWPTRAHRKIAQTVLLCNPLVKTRDALINGTQRILKVPKKRIKKLTLDELIREFDFDVFVA